MTGTNTAPSSPTVTAQAPPACTVPCTVTFAASGTDPDNDALVFEWGGCAAGQLGSTASCRIETPQVVTATATARDGRGGQATGQATGTGLDPGQNVPPTARAGGPYRATVGKSITLDGRQSKDVDGSITSFAWTFGDGTTGTGPTSMHTYTAAGSFPVNVTVTDDHQAATTSPVVSVIVDPDVDADDDGLTDALEQSLGSNPNDADSNDDGVTDGTARALGLSLTSSDTDGDGLSNAEELAAGTDPIKADTDADGVLDGADAFPLDPSRSASPPPDPGDHTPPTITLERPQATVLQ
jgi:hypothetical protein